MKTNLSSTHIGITSNIKDYARNAKKFLIDNANRITFDHDEETKLLSTGDSMSHTLISDLYQQALHERKLDIFRLLILDKVDKMVSHIMVGYRCS